MKCTCGVSEPDEFGNRDLREAADCPYHGEDSMSDELRERVVAALQRSQVLTLQADAVLAALGLNDLDAAVERCGDALERRGWTVSTPGDPPGAGLADLALGLRAALTPPDGKDTA